MLNRLFQFYLAPDYDDPAGADTATEKSYDDAGASHEAESGEQETDREALESKVGDKLDSLLSDEEPSTADDDSEYEYYYEEESDDSDEDSEDADTQDDSEAESEEDDTEEAAAEDEEHQDPSDAPTLPSAYRRSLYAYGWQDDEIDQNLRNLGDSFIKTAERIHENRNQELQQWAKAGREAREQEDTDEGQQGSGGQEKAPSAKSGSKDSTPQKLQPVDADKLKQEYGDDELIDHIVGPVNKTIEQVNQILPQLEQGQQAAQQAEIDRVSRDVDGFFAKEDMQAYNELYGDSSQGLTDKQLEMRNKVLDTAYDLMVGAQTLRGQNMNLHDALEYAHEIAAKDQKETAVRKSVKKEAKQRNRGLSQKPSRRKGSSSNKSGNERPQSREDLENRTSGRLKQAFGE